MATLEKPKKEKYKKSKAKSRNEVEEGESHEKREIKNDDPATTTTKAAKVKQCKVIETENSDKSELTCDLNIPTGSEEIAKVEKDTSQNLDNVDESKEKENDSLDKELANKRKESSSPRIWTENFEPRQVPTAPPADTSNVLPFAAAMPTTAIIQYPSLTKMFYDETVSKVSYQSVKASSPASSSASKVESQLKPYTSEQLKKIYDCQELELVKQFELEFLMNSLLESQETDPLYAALLEYYNLQSKININLQNISKLRKEVDEIAGKIWKKTTATKEFSGKCGDNVTVREIVTYEDVTCDNKNLELTSAALKRLFDEVVSEYTENHIGANVSKVKIDRMINEAISYPHVAASFENSSIVLQKKLDADTLPCMAHIRRAIAILFSFVRRVSPNATFDSNLKDWLSKLISLHLLLATKEDHWFLLFNILRCPSGVGKWAAKFVQVPCSCKKAKTNEVNNHVNELPLPLDSPEIGNCIAVLQILLFPIKKRNEYLKAFAQNISGGSNKEENWIVVDSDGEDSHTASGDCVGLKESDLISLLHQIPFERLFCSALAIEKYLEDYLISANLISTNEMLRVVAFFSKLIEIFGEGMLTYNTERYKQFAKHIGRLTRHTLQYLFDYHALFISNNLSKDPVTCERIAVELNALLIKVCSYIYRTRNIGTWIYFSSLPFRALYAKTVWQLFYYLNVGFPDEFPVPQEDHINDLNSVDFWAKFNVANADVAAEDMYYLLQAFYEMANGRDRVKDWELIKVICLHIFNIGHTNPLTRDICYKTSRDLLLNLTLAYEDLLSTLLLQLKIRFNEIENAPYLFKTLPLENWKPGIENFEILSNWLLHYDFQKPENMTARVIIGHLNWGFDMDGRLFLPHHIHVRMACLISEALNKHAPEKIGVSTITESVRQVSNFINYSQSTKENFSTWCWNMVSLMRLHLMDQSKETRMKTLSNPTESLAFVPELERIDTIFQGVTENRPLAIYVALLVSLHGHSIPLICQRGFELMKLLLNDQRHASVIRTLEVIMPLFVHSTETLANCENFQMVMLNLLNADKTYLKMAKDAIYSNSIGIVLEMLDNMIHRQITSYTEYGFSSPQNLIQIWLQCLTSLPNWQNSNVLYLLDRLLRVAYQFPDARIQTFEFFCNFYKDCNEWKNSNITSSIKNFFGSTQSRIPTLSPFQPWLSLFLLEVEFKLQDAHFWPELLRQLATQGSKTNLDAALKKTASVVQMPSFPANMLVIYKYANLIASMDLNQPLFAIFNQKFFELFLSHVPLHYDEQSFQLTYGVSDKFYEHNVPLMKRIKTNLKAAAMLYSNESKKRADDESMSYFYRNCEKMMNAFGLWLEETTINKFSKETINLPPQYCNEKLKEILQGNTPHWTEFIYLPAIRKDQLDQAEQWARKCFRHKSIKPLRSSVKPSEKKTPIESIKMHLRSYDECQEPPKYVKPKDPVHKVINKQTTKELQKQLKTLSTFAEEFLLQTMEFNSMNIIFPGTVVKLYHFLTASNVLSKPCKQNCTNPARIAVTTKTIVIRPEVEKKLRGIHKLRNRFIDEIVNKEMGDYALNIDQIGCTVRTLITSQISSRSVESVIKSTGVKFFYAIIESLNETTMKFPPTNERYMQLLSELSIFIQDNQEEHGLTVLEIALKRPELIKVLSSAFVPFRTRPEHFIKMYKFLIESHLRRCDKNILFVLFSKFDLETWFSNFQPKLFEIEELLELVLRGLESWSQPDSLLLQDQFRRHLVHIFNFNFPEHYGEVLQKVLERISDQKLMPNILLDLLNSLLDRFNCGSFDLNTTQEQIQKISIDFARAQNLFNFNAAQETILLFGRHFQKERLNHGLHGLYPKHKDYCKPLAMWFSCFGHMLCVTAICSHQNLLADQLSDLMFSSIVDMYAPWLIVYTPQTMQQNAPSNWIRQLTENLQMLPWSALHANTSKIIIMPFINTLRFILEHLPSSHQILVHTFGWYVHHFAIPNLESSVYSPIHEGLANLPWELFRPRPNNIERLHECLRRFVPEAHSMLGHIFIRIDWNAWFVQTLPSLSSQAQVQTVSQLFAIFVKIAFEPSIHVQSTTSQILEGALNYPWQLVDYEELEALLKWFSNSVEPSIILKIPTENNDIDRAVLSLLRFACAMMSERPSAAPNFQDSAKRVLYTRAFIRLLRNCAVKNQKLLETKDGRKAFDGAFAELLSDMDAAVHKLEPTSRALIVQQHEALNMIMEIIMPMETQSQEVSNFQIDTMIEWQERAEAGNLLTTAILSSLGNMRSFMAAIYALLEATLISYFRISEQTKDYHRPSWLEACRLMKLSLDKLELMPILSGPYYLSLHIFLLYRLERIENSGDQITFLQDVIQLTESFKTNPQTEAHLGIVWGIIIARGCKVLSVSEHSKKPLLMLARSLNVIAKQNESWGEGLLGAIGLRRESGTNRRKILARCLACVLFSIFPEASESNPQPNPEFMDSMQELTVLSSNKKYSDIKPLMAKAENIINESKFPNLRDVPHLVCRLIALFYDDNLLTTIPEVWDFDFKL